MQCKVNLWLPLITEVVTSSQWTSSAADVCFDNKQQLCVWRHEQTSSQTYEELQFLLFSSRPSPLCTCIFGIVQLWISISIFTRVERNLLLLSTLHQLCRSVCSHHAFKCGIIKFNRMTAFTALWHKINQEKLLLNHILQRSNTLLQLLREWKIS